MRVLLCAEIIVVFMIGTACATYGSLEEHYGKSYETAKSNQILNPGSTKNLKPVTGITGKAADRVMKQYTDSFSPSGQAPQIPESFAVTPIVLPADGGTGQNAHEK